VLRRFVEITHRMHGDVVLTGSPAGVGPPRGEFLKPGNKVIATAEDAGELHIEIA
jgi:2-keto-4-pentenoate hydratase/2-oxohepta-3-ene-1,7-dioic acid hydratase in catechol pathway